MGLLIMQPFSIGIDMIEGVTREPARHNVRRASDMRGYYRDEDALERLISERNDPLHYETFEAPLPEESGHLLFCVSRIQPGAVGDECFMTKGHYHAIAHTAEVHLCLTGRGCMMMKTSDGRCASEMMTPGRVVYVPPYWAHRSINTGREPLSMFCVWPADAGHNYGDIAREGFPKRVLLRNGELVVQ